MKTIAELGGKGYNLARLQDWGLPVPAWFAVPVSLFQSLIENGPVERDILEAGAHPDQADACYARIRAALLTQPFSAEFENALRRDWTARFSRNEPVAVRSSSAQEDAAGHSFAGIHDSFLWVRGLEATGEAIRRVWASAFSPRALAYRRENGLSLKAGAMAVIIQQMVESRSSGVVFTANPVTGSTDECVISAVYGLGEGLVSAGFDADTFTVHKQKGETARILAEKSEQFQPDRANGGIRREPVPEPARSAPSLTDGQVAELARLGLVIESACGWPQDIEFAVDAKGCCLILQTRPITTVASPGPAAGNRLIWDNSNIIESYSGVTSPMTFSFIRRAYTIVYHCFCGVMGIPAKTVRANQPVFENMLGLIRGQVYYNLINWYRMLQLFPGYDYNREFMESMMGVKESLHLPVSKQPPSLARRYFVELPRLLALVIRMIVQFATLPRRVAEFNRNFTSHYNRWAAERWNDLKPHELMATYRDMEDALLWNWKTPIINDFYVMVFYGILKKLSRSWAGDDKGSLQNDLICGEGGIESTVPARLLLEMAAEAQRDPVLREMILHDPPDELARAIPRDERFRAFSDRIARYLEDYGFRCMNELKLEEKSLRDNPAFIYRVLRNYLAIDNPAALDVEAIGAREALIRGDAEARVRQALAGPGRWLKRALFFFVLKHARRGVKNRENLRFARTKIYGLLRELIRAQGRRFAEAGVLEDPDDVFYLTLDECRDFVSGTAVTIRLAELAALRKREFADYRQATDEAPGERIETFGMVYHRNPFRQERKVRWEGKPGHLRGIGCCPGEITGPVKVIRAPGDDIRLNREILVAERTDPGWVPLYPAISGLLIERGSILSHSAIVAREMGIPTIVGIPGLTASLKSGQTVRMNGAAGTVEIIGESTG